jgi:hypothetical protein
MSIGNGYENIGELYADVKKLQQEERADRLAKRVRELAEIMGAGHTVRQFNGGSHWRIGDIDFWPSTGRWVNARTGANGRLPDEKPVLHILAPTRETASSK